MPSKHFNVASMVKSFCVLFSVQVRTLFVSGLPMDAKPRELYLLFRAYEVIINIDQLLSTGLYRLPKLMVIL